MNQEQTQNTESAPKNGKRKFIILAVVFAIAIGIFIYWILGRGWVETDDAQVDGDLVPINARVSGYVNKIYIDDNQEVLRGQLLAQFDQRDLQARLRSAQANLATQKAQSAAASAQLALTQETAPAGAGAAGAQVSAAGSGVSAAQSQIASAEAQVASAVANAAAARDAVGSARSDVTSAQAQIDSARAAIQVAQANVSAAEAQAERTASDAARFRQLVAQGAASTQQNEVAQAANKSAQAALRAAREQIASANAAVAQAKARKASAEAAVKQSISRANAADAAVSQARTGVTSARAALSSAQAQLQGAESTASGARTVPQQVAIGSAQSRAAVARVNQAIADVRNARLQLLYTTVVSPVTGIVSQKSVEPGQYVQPGQMLMAVVPLDRVWVTANFKENQIGGMRTGQVAEIKVDAYPGREFRGRVQSIGAATGATFSLLPPQNATGNYVKVVQRIPVKIVLDERLPRGVVLRPGMNVVASVKVSGKG